jgi:hypothetical protein
MTGITGGWLVLPASAIGTAASSAPVDAMPWEKPED